MRAVEIRIQVAPGIIEMLRCKTSETTIASLTGWIEKADVGRELSVRIVETPDEEGNGE